MRCYPPSLPVEIRARSFAVANGELGLRMSDVDAFLDACSDDDIVVLAWEVWVIFK